MMFMIGVRSCMVVFSFCAFIRNLLLLLIVMMLCLGCTSLVVIVVGSVNFMFVSLLVISIVFGLCVGNMWVIYSLCRLMLEISMFLCFSVLWIFYSVCGGCIGNLLLFLVVLKCLIMMLFRCDPRSLCGVSCSFLVSRLRMW